MQGARDSTNQRRVSVDQSEPSSQNATRGAEMTSTRPRTVEMGHRVQGAPDSTNQCEIARDSTNQSSPPGMQRAVQKGRRFVSERSVELSKSASASSGDTDTSDNFRSCNPGVFNSGATYRLELQCYHLAGKSERKKKQQQPQQQQQGIINVVQCKGGHPFVDPTENVGGPDSATCIYEG